MMKTIRLESVDSTNTYAKRMIRETGAEGPVLITAKEQTGGRGRSGKSFSSLRGNGIYMTLVLPFTLRPEEAVFITVACGVAVHRALTTVTGQPLTIKWVNDLYLGDKKVAGILTEAVTDPASGCMTHAVIGVGINLNADRALMPEELREIAGTLSYPGDAESLPSFLAGQILETVELAFSGSDGRSEVLSCYRENAYLTGKRVSFEKNGEKREGFVEGIDDAARLLVRTEAGTAALDSGEVSVRFR